MQKRESEFIMARPKRVFSDEETARIYNAALDNCHLDTIAIAMDIPKTTLVRRFGTIIKQKRAEGRMKLRANQVRLSRYNAQMAQFLGKNELGQEDKQTVRTETTAPPMTAQELKASEAAARIYKLRMAQGQAG